MRLPEQRLILSLSEESALFNVVISLISGGNLHVDTGRGDLSLTRWLVGAYYLRVCHNSHIGFKPIFHPKANISQPSVITKHLFVRQHRLSLTQIHPIFSISNLVQASYPNPTTFLHGIRAENQADTNRIRGRGDRSTRSARRARTQREK